MLQFFMAYLYIHPVRFNIFWNFGKTHYFRLLSINTTIEKPWIKPPVVSKNYIQCMLLDKQEKILSIIVNIKPRFTRDVFWGR